MSRSNNTEVRNPATKFIEWGGSEGTLSYYDKEKKENVNVPIPFQFLVLDVLHTIAGFSDADKSGYWSNEVRDLKKEKFAVRTKKGLEEENLYGDLKCLRDGAKYAQSIYIAMKDANGQLVIANLKLAGSGIGSWIDFRKKTDIYKVACVLSDKTSEKKGATKYFAPVFTSTVVSADTNAKANELDGQLQEYLKAYFAKRGVESDANTHRVDATVASTAGEPAAEPVAHDMPPEDIDSLPF